jgi:hypothetical protein
MATSATSGSNSALDGLGAQLGVAADAFCNKVDAADHIWDIDGIGKLGAIKLRCGCKNEPKNGRQRLSGQLR